ncbi:TetR/AcrR family transcriptional regulator [Rhodococcus wratislaviensis]|uniref:TetR/AcrR family transcriptional regulator n=1 Tax=Rhodococcus wratislaviensis TaxID=44752 RepID=UPI003664ABC5
MPAPERRRQIIDAATRVISREGVSKATTRRICEEARANIGTLHYTFSGKNDLFEAVFAYCWDVVSEIVDDAVSSSTGEPEDTAREIISRYTELAITDPHLLSAQFQLLNWSMTRPAARGEAAAAYDQQHAVIASALRRDGSWPSPDFDSAGVARMIVSLLDGMCIRFSVTNSVDQLRLDARAAIDMVQRSFTVAVGS